MMEDPSIRKTSIVARSASPEAIAALLANPHFPQAMRLSAAGIASLYQGRRPINLLMDDKSRVLFGYFALYLHFSVRPDEPGSGLTPSRMKELCREFDICSRGRAEVMLSLMRYAGYLSPAPDPRDRRVNRLVATPRLVALLRERWRVWFTALAPMLPEGRAALDVLDDENFAREMLKAMMLRFRAGNRFIAVPIPDDMPALQLFADRNAGMLILASLISTAEADGATASIAGLARRFGVSRTHVLKLLRDAEDEGSIRITQHAGERRIVLLPRLMQEAEKLFAAVHAYLADSAREALAGMGRPLE